jgi:hypothetical protein
MARTWLSIRVELVEGRGERFWPRPGRILAAARSHTFAQLADAIDDAFARWDRAHLHKFELADGLRLTTPYEEWDSVGSVADDRRTNLSRLKPGEQFVYVFDFGDDWTHLCTRGARAHRPARCPRHHPGRAPIALGLGQHPGPERPPLGGRRWGVTSAREPRRLRPAPAPPVVGRARVTALRKRAAPLSQQHYGRGTHRVGRRGTNPARDRAKSCLSGNQTWPT